MFNLHTIRQMNEDAATRELAATSPATAQVAATGLSREERDEFDQLLSALVAAYRLLRALGLPLRHLREIVLASVGQALIDSATPDQRVAPISCNGGTSQDD